MTTITVRPYASRTADMLSQQGLHPVLARIYAARGINDISELSTELSALLPPAGLLNNERAAVLLADAIAAKKKICIVADYDCDGATACAVAIHGLKMMGGDVSFLVPNRFDNGYGLTPAIVDEARKKHGTQVLVTVDNGIASIDGVLAAVSQGMEVLVTDHHLPGDSLPENCVIVNPNHPACTFDSRNLAGVGVIFYVMLALRAELRKRGVFDAKSQPRLDSLLDLVALGTVADVVRLDRNNRILVAQGLKRIAAGNMHTGIAALFRAAGREWRRATTFDLGFTVAPRLNAAGRLSDMALGVECLVTDDEGRAWEIAQTLNKINQERREIESGMRDEALAMLENFQPDESASISVLDANWHQGVIGILASRLKDQYYRPVFVFAPDKDGNIRGSGRSIPGFHLRDAIDLVAKRHPGMISRFGGHAMAAGLTMQGDAYDVFCEAFEAIAKEFLNQTQLERVIETDGTPDNSCYTLDFVHQLESRIWGQGFEPPIFSDRFHIVNQRVLKERHLSLQLEKNGMALSAIYFNHTALLPRDARLAFRIASNEYNGMTSVQLIVEYGEAA
ncbi:single-stranded-DNA-specific exonuclease RecJ [Oxalobacter vibrioformis]|uniref:Single-stranded-DNA-specific exonuclease RecJ n=1 Tax=Oxalobacter vibrioformis TaxID=933080 RepID=A0A9E9LZ85_9BURK|nr:single-stranded-DNA-specific exonuclease RecJ [Oxalobacter vibrioformis]WAW09963.1 single-stranded-DNA-specific exonuclease RecJ [Oxalobacter vibrioformis]